MTLHSSTRARLLAATVKALLAAGAPDPSGA